MRPRHNFAWLIVFTGIILMFLWLPPMAAKQEAVVSTYRALVEVDALAKQHYVETIADDCFVRGAIRGMLRQLDPYSGYLAPDELKAFQRRTLGNYTGIGLEIGMRAGRPTVIAPLEGSPAALAGVTSGDVLLAVNERKVDGLSAFDIKEQLQGASGTSVRLTVRHHSDDEPRQLVIPRTRLSLGTVRGFRRDPQGAWDYLIDPSGPVGYIRVSNFHANTISDFHEAVSGLMDRGVRGLILDLRFNPGGKLDQGVAMVDRFIDDRLIVSTVTRRQVVREYSATTKGTLVGIELAVLINGGTASAAEIVAGSLQDHERAVIVGERSFGKGSVQSLMHLASEEAAIMLTTAYYRLPSGRIIHRHPSSAESDDWGILPDVEVRLNKDEINAIQQARRAAESTAVGIPENPGQSGASACGPEVLRDRQLRKALSLLREHIPPV